MSTTTPPELVRVWPALPDDEEELTSPDPKLRTAPSGSPLLLLLGSSSVLSVHTFLYVHSILKHEDELLELDEEEELLELEDEEEEELLELDDEEDDEDELEEELDEELDELEDELDEELDEELEEELDEELEEELEEELDEELLIHRSSSI